MKKWMNDKYTTIAIYALLVLLAATLFLFAILNIGTIWDTVLFILFAARSVVFGIVIALIIFPLCHNLERWLARIGRKHFKKEWKIAPLRMVAVTLAYLIVLLLLGVVVVSVLPMLNQNYAQLQETLTGYVNALLELLQKNELIYNLIVSLVGVSGQTAQEFINNLLIQYSAYLSSFAGNLITILTTVITSTSDIIVALILSFYFLLSRDMITGLIRKLATACLPEKFRFWSARFCRRFYTNILEFLSARILCSFMLGVLCYLLTWALNIPFYPLLSIIVFVLNMIPIFGPIVAGLLCSVITFIVQPEATWVLVLVIILINLTEHLLIERSLLSKRLRPSVGATLIAVLLFSYFFGFWGAIFAVPVWVSAMTEGRSLLNRRLRKKGIILTEEGTAETGNQQHEAEAMQAEHTEEVDDIPDEAKETNSETVARIQRMLEKSNQRLKGGILRAWRVTSAFCIRLFQKTVSLFRRKKK